MSLKLLNNIGDNNNPHFHPKYVANKNKSPLIIISQKYYYWRIFTNNNKSPLIIFYSGRRGILKSRVYCISFVVLPLN